jgi:hypothetical protein
MDLSDLSVQPGEVQDVFQVNFSDGVAMIGTVNKGDGSIRDVTILGDGSDPATLLLAWAYLIQTTNPSLSADQRGDVLRDLGVFDTDDFDGLDERTERNGISYHVSATAGLGIFFSAGDAREQ